MDRWFVTNCGIQKEERVWRAWLAKEDQEWISTMMQVSAYLWSCRRVSCCRGHCLCCCSLPLHVQVSKMALQALEARVRCYSSETAQRNNLRKTFLSWKSGLVCRHMLRACACFFSFWDCPFITPGRACQMLPGAPNLSTLRGKFEFPVRAI